MLFTITVFVVYNANAQEARARCEMMKIILQEKLDLALPGAIRDNNVDMWIQVMQDGYVDPLYLDLGVRVRMNVRDNRCYVIFTDRG
jgi:Xaa-Pro dipeptidase